MIAKIAVSAATFAIDKPYSYRFDGDLRPGIRVQVPFGAGNRNCEGIVLEVCRGDESKLKSIVQILDDTPVLPDHMLRLAAFMRDRYFCTFYEAARAMLPSGLWFKTIDRVTLSDENLWKGKCIRQEDALKILEFLEESGGVSDVQNLKNLIPEEEKRTAALKYLLRKKWIKTASDFLRRTGDQSEQIATLAASAEEAMEFASHRPKSAAMQKAVLQVLCGVGSVTVKELCYFTGASTATVRRLEKLGYLKLTQRPVLRCREIQPARLDGPLILTEDQTEAYQGILNQMNRDDPGIAVLFGVTGSGKTSVYLKLIHDALDHGKSAALLVPEIGLTPQLLSLLTAYFGDQVAVLHSSLSSGERYDQWKRIQSGAAKVVVGTRSAVFAPMEHPGIFILDEEQEHTYKSENTPRYSAKEIAIWRGARENALVLLGSATPSMETMYRARTGVYSLYELHSRFNGKKLPQVEIVDMREELKAGNDSPFSSFLLESIRDNVKNNKQTILFLNRRGNARALVCVDCGESPECVRCSNKLTYHSANGRLMCHYCGHSQPVPVRCPKCGGPLKTIGVGTQKIQEALEFEFPDLEILRMDADTVNAVNTHEKMLKRFQEEHISILIGTQMIAKGLNLPDVTLVGVLDADLSLYSGNYRAAETTFHMLTQVVGRAGRGASEGRAVIQTMAPDHQIIRLGAEQDYCGFYNLEIGLRRVMKLPPFGDCINITFIGENEAAVMRGAACFRDNIDCWMKENYREPEGYMLLGPAPCPMMKINYHFRYRLTLQCNAKKEIRRVLGAFLMQFMKDRHYRGVSAFIDINGYE